MRTILFVLALCLGGAAAADPALQGRWEIVMPSLPTFSGELAIDAEGRALFTGAVINDPRQARSRGYVSRLSETRAEITLTAGKTVSRIRCTIQSADVLNCDDVGSGGTISALYYMRRIGPGPVSLAK